MKEGSDLSNLCNTAVRQVRYRRRADDDRNR